MRKEVFECPSCSEIHSIDELDLNEKKHILNCPNCGATILENYRGE